MIGALVSIVERSDIPAVDNSTAVIACEDSSGDLVVCDGSATVTTSGETTTFSFTLKSVRQPALALCPLIRRPLVRHLLRRLHLLDGLLDPACLGAVSSPVPASGQLPASPLAPAGTATAPQTLASAGSGPLPVATLVHVPSATSMAPVRPVLVFSLRSLMSCSAYGVPSCARWPRSSCCYLVDSRTPISTLSPLQRARKISRGFYRLQQRVCCYQLRRCSTKVTSQEFSTEFRREGRCRAPRERSRLGQRKCPH